MGKKSVRLKNKADAARLRRQRNAALAGIDRQTFKLDLAVIRLHGAREEIRDRRLPGSRFSAKHIDALLKIELSVKREAAKRLSESGLQHVRKNLPRQMDVVILNMNSEAHSSRLSLLPQEIVMSKGLPHPLS